MSTEKRTAAERREYKRAYHLRNKEKDNAYGRAWRVKNPEKAKRPHDPKKWESYYKRNRDKILARSRLVKYGVTPEDYQRMFSQQKGLCGICKARPASHTDHDHKTGVVRGLLCQQCNQGIGLLQESPEILLSAIDWVSQ